MYELGDIPLCVLGSHRNKEPIKFPRILSTRNVQITCKNNGMKCPLSKHNDLSTDTVTQIEKKPEAESTMNKILKPKKGMCEIELLAMKNRAEHLALLQSLKIEEAKAGFRQAVEELKPKRKPVKRIYKKSEPSSPPVLRKSRRLAKLDVDLSEGALFAKALERAEQAEKIIKKEIPPILPFENALCSKESYEDFSKNFSSPFHGKCESGNIIKNYASRFQFMKIDDSQVAKVVPSRITSIAINPLPDRVIVTAGDKYGNMGFWKVDSHSDPYLFEVHYQSISHLQYNPSNPNLIISSSYDGSLRSGDLENRVFSEIYADEYSSCTYFDFLSSTSLIVGKKNGCIAVVDFRNSKTSAKNHVCHDYTIKTVSCHPVNKNYFITAMNKGTVSLWDLRKLQKDPVANITHHKRSVNSAYFSSLTGNSILTTSLDDSICIFDSSVLTKHLTLKKRLSHNNFTGRWLSIFRANWLPETDEVFVVGSMQHPRRIEIYDDKMNNMYNFMDENLSSITSVNTFHPSKPVLAGGNSSGKVFVFMDSQ